MKTTRMTDPRQILPSPKSSAGTPENDLPAPEIDSLQEKMPDTEITVASTPEHHPTHTKPSSDPLMGRSEIDPPTAAMDKADHLLVATPPFHRLVQVGPIVKEIDLERNQTGIQRHAGHSR